jgi:hypothetical protein
MEIVGENSYQKAIEDNLEYRADTLTGDHEKLAECFMVAVIFTSYVSIM